MPDIATKWVPLQGYGDWSVVASALASDDDLVTAILISIFTDRRAEADDVIPDGTTNRRGWWGDLDQGLPIGSRLWLLDRSKLTTQVAGLAKAYIAESVQWLIDDGVVARFDITTEIKRPVQLGVKLTAFKQDRSTLSLEFSWAWAGIV